MNKERCSFCNKKLKLISYSCKCNGKFCQKHRYTHSHNCKSLNKKIEESKKNLENNNPVVNHSKVIKI
uniref:AN1-type domain-containing protein n=1 Tax=viral metagenome TaxID=1070528 RepID=A0A6C0C728_9ZZZZ